MTKIWSSRKGLSSGAAAAAWTPSWAAHCSARLSAQLGTGSGSAPRHRHAVHPMPPAQQLWAHTRADLVCNRRSAAGAARPGPQDDGGHMPPHRLGALTSHTMHSVLCQRVSPTSADGKAAAWALGSALMPAVATLDRRRERQAAALDARPPPQLSHTCHACCALCRSRRWRSASPRAVRGDLLPLRRAQCCPAAAPDSTQQIDPEALGLPGQAPAPTAGPRDGSLSL